MIKGSISEDTAIINIHAPNIGVPEYTKANINRHKWRYQQ